MSKEAPQDQPTEGMEGVEQGTGSQTHRSQTTGSQTAIPESESPTAGGGGSATGEQTPPLQEAAEAAVPSVAASQPSQHAEKAHSKHRSRHRTKGRLELETAKIGFIGAGKMAEAIVDGIVEYGQIKPSQIFVASPSGRNLDRFKAKNIKVSKRPYEIFSRYDCDIIFLCFHGKVIKECYSGDPDRPRSFCVNYIPNMKHPLYILSMVSGCTLDEIKACMLNPDHPEKYVIEAHRVMINAACAYGLGLVAVDVEVDSKKLSSPIRTLLSKLGKLEFIPKEQMDAACACGGYGLAFSYNFINSLVDGGLKVGLSKELAQKFAARTAHSGARTLLESGLHPDELRDQVITPGGAAMEGIHHLEKSEFSHAVAAAIETAFARAKTLASA